VIVKEGGSLGVRKVKNVRRVVASVTTQLRAAESLANGR